MLKQIFALSAAAVCLFSLGSIPRSLLRDHERAALFPGGQSPLE